MVSAADQISKKVRKKKRVTKTKARKSRKDPGLLHGTMSVSIEDVTPRMRKPCRQCAEPLKTRRLLVKEGAGRYAKTHPYCMACGVDWLEARWAEYDRAVAFLRLGCIPANKRRTDLEEEGIRDV